MYKHNFTYISVCFFTVRQNCLQVYKTHDTCSCSQNYDIVKLMMPNLCHSSTYKPVKKVCEILIVMLNHNNNAVSLCVRVSVIPLCCFVEPVPRRMSLQQSPNQMISCLLDHLDAIDQSKKNQC